MKLAHLPVAVGVAIAVAGAIPAGRAAAQEQVDKEQSDQRLGTVHFQTSCNETAQRRFDRGMRYQHSFWYRESKEIFEEALKADPECAIAYWGIAQSLLANPFNPTPPKNLAEGLADVERAERIGAKTDRERDLIAATKAYYADFEKQNQRTRAQSYAKAMEAVAARHPNDDEIQISYALALDIAAAPTDKTYANQRKAASILEPIFQRQPRHPGVAHYLIHTYDYPALAGKGLDAAQRYARIAEAAPHAQHMPSHIFTRIGYWKESVVSNDTAARLARSGKEPDDQLHASDYMVYACLQMGDDRKARDLIDGMQSVAGYNVERNTGPFALAASPARYAVERGDWAAAMTLELRASRFGYIDAMTHFARALGQVHAGTLESARAERDLLSAIGTRLREAKDAYWAEQVEIQRRIVDAWILAADGRYDDALKAMGEAADAEDRTEKATVTPGPLAPARELYGFMLLERRKAKDALAAFEATLAKEPNRLGATIGAARAARQAGNTEKARKHYQAAVALTEQADTLRPEIAEARAFVAEPHPSR